MGQLGLTLTICGLVGVVVFGFSGMEPMLHKSFYLACGGVTILALGLFAESKNGDPGFRLVMVIGLLVVGTLLW